MQRVLVVGTTGSGKTTVAAAVARAIDAPHVELDALHWGHDWEPADPEVFRDRVADAAAVDRWVICGNYYTTLADITWPRADTVVWLDLPRALVMRRLVKRTARRVATRAELWNGNRESLRSAFGRDSILRWGWQSHARNLQRYAEMIDDPQFASLTWFRLRSPAAVHRFLAELPGDR